MPDTDVNFELHTKHHDKDLLSQRLFKIPIAQLVPK